MRNKRFLLVSRKELEEENLVVQASFALFDFSALSFIDRQQLNMFNKKKRAEPNFLTS
jgi:hypothetical protein